METKGAKYQFISITWQHPGHGGWHFIALPIEISREIRDHLQSEEEGWGRLKAVAQIGNTQWNTAIWYDTKRSAYLLPLKADVRKKENIAAGKEVTAFIWI